MVLHGVAVLVVELMSRQVTGAPNLDRKQTAIRNGAVMRIQSEVKIIPLVDGANRIHNFVTDLAKKKQPQQQQQQHLNKMLACSSSSN